MFYLLLFAAPIVHAYTCCRYHLLTEGSPAVAPGPANFDRFARLAYASFFHVCWARHSCQKLYAPLHRFAIHVEEPANLNAAGTHDVIASQTTGSFTPTSVRLCLRTSAPQSTRRGRNLERVRLLRPPRRHPLHRYRPSMPQLALETPPSPPAFRALASLQGRQGLQLLRRRQAGRQARNRLRHLPLVVSSQNASHHQIALLEMRIPRVGQGNAGVFAVWAKVSGAKGLQGVEARAKTSQWGAR